MVFRTAVGAVLFLRVNFQLQTTTNAEGFFRSVQSTAVGAKFPFATTIVQHGLLNNNVAKVFDVVHHLQLGAFRISKGTKTITAVDGIVGVELSAMGANLALDHLVHGNFGNACATLVTEYGRQRQHFATLGAGGHFRCVGLVVQIGHFLTEVYGNGGCGCCLS